VDARNKGLPTKKISHPCGTLFSNAWEAVLEQGEQGRKNIMIIFALKIE